MHDYECECMKILLVKQEMSLQRSWQPSSIEAAFHIFLAQWEACSKVTYACILIFMMCWGFETNMLC